MKKIPLLFGMWNKLKDVLDFSEPNIKNSCICGSTLRLKGFINNVFSQICCEDVSQIQKKKTCLEWSLYAKHLGEVSLDGLLYCLTGIFVFS